MREKKSRQTQKGVGDDRRIERRGTKRKRTLVTTTEEEQT